MTEKSGPFDTANWNEDDWARAARLWAPDCVESGADDQLLLEAVSGLNTRLKFGNGWVRGFSYRLQDAYKSFTHVSSAGTAGQSRNDLVVLHLDRTANTIDARVLTGAFAVTPTDPVLTKDDTAQIWEMPLWRVNIVANALSVGTFTDLRRLWIPGATVAKFFSNITLDVTGLATVQHGLGRTPVAVVVTPNAPIAGGAASTIFASAMVDNLTATTFRIKGLHADATYVTGLVSFFALFA